MPESMIATLTPLPVCPVWVQESRVAVSTTEPALLRNLGTILETFTTSERLASSRSFGGIALEGHAPHGVGRGVEHLGAGLGGQGGAGLVHGLADGLDLGGGLDRVLPPVRTPAGCVASKALWPLSWTKTAT